MSVNGGKAGSNGHDLVASVALADLSLNAGVVKEIVAAVASKEEVGKEQDVKQPATEAKTGGCEHCHKANPTKRLLVKTGCFLFGTKLQKLKLQKTQEIQYSRPISAENSTFSVQT